MDEATKSNSSQPAAPYRKKARQDKDVQLSKTLSWALRHAASSSLGLTLSSDGYVPIQALLESSHPRFKGVSMEDIKRVVDENDKQRFRICPKQVICEGIPGPTSLKYTIMMDGTGDRGIVRDMLCIRANQGHTISGISSEEMLQQLHPEELAGMDVIVHGTSLNSWENHIRHEGLCRMKRNHIHFATGLPGEGTVISGMRASAQLELTDTWPQFILKSLIIKGLAAIKKLQRGRLSNQVDGS